LRRTAVAEVTMAQALNEALRFSLKEDDRVLVFGEDIGRLGGVFRITDKLQDEFGEERVFDTPLAESGIAGISVGLALAGWKPVPEMQFDAFSYPALDQVISHVAKYRFRVAGDVGLPLVVRIPCGGGVGAAEHHSESPETYYAHTAGLKVVIPSTALDAFNLLVRAVRDPDPVIFFEPKSRYWSKEEGRLEPNGLPIGRARVLREGRHGSLVCWGGMVARCLEVAAAAAEDGVELEVLDLRSLVPLDLEALAETATKTGRVVVVHEAPLTAGFGAEVVARVVEDCFDHLEAPVLRVAGYDVPYPPATIEEHYLPSVDRILAAVDRTLRW
jgi:2-oxoisovalerate dehydrogenase E1 component beta subunit